MKILIVDDDPISLRINQHAVEQWGHEAVKASGGTQALSIYKAEAPTIVVVDWMMPGMDGLELTGHLKKLASNDRRKVFVIMVTARTGFNDVLEAFEAGVDDFLMKPVEPPMLMERLSEADKQLAEQFSRSARPTIGIETLLKKTGDRQTTMDFLMALRQELEDKRTLLTGVLEESSGSSDHESGQDLTMMLRELREVALMMEANLIISRIDSLAGEFGNRDGLKHILEALTRTLDVINSFVNKG